MEYNRDYFIFGEPIQTKFGAVRFLTYKEYLSYLPQLSLISMNTLHIYYHYKNEVKKPTEEEKQTLLEFKETPLYQIVLSTPQFLQTYIEIFTKLITFNENVDCSEIFANEKDFMDIRKLIMDMNVVTEEEVSPNEEIQRGFERSRRAKQLEAPKQSFLDIVTCIVTGTPHSFEEVSKMNVMQIYALYGRIGAFFNYKTSTLFATVAEKVNVELWNKHINLFEKESHAIEYDKFKNKTGSIFND
ncbi:hypothetical protein M3649_04185 [Ureibacillus chungkukjangi]|uniref:hypothetical protein n=1 Tax=Ureibacillus chungkukjangi TaxID=1202712 RepID=UPI00203F3508|nr:hypothetical protein [Ureibacillus chungkukjangi]MCM3387332.1 hypothetical protein [Ureibacillus chungkukjangi]